MKQLDKDSYNAGLDRAIELLDLLKTTVGGQLKETDQARMYELVEATCDTLETVFKAERLK